MLGGAGSVEFAECGALSLGFGVKEGRGGWSWLVWVTWASKLYFNCWQDGCRGEVSLLLSVICTRGVVVLRAKNLYVGSEGGSSRIREGDDSQAHPCGHERARL